MNLLQRKSGLISLALMLPALFLGTAGILHVAFGIEAANHALESMLSQTVFKPLLSPVVALGGPLAAFVLNAWKVLHVSADVVNEEFVIALSVKRLFSHLLCLALAAGLLLLLACYDFVENFKIIAR
jgi:hypothetical protein